MNSNAAASIGEKSAQTLFDKIWSRHVVLDREDGLTLIYIDLHLIHEVSRLSFKALFDRGLTVRRPDRTFATPDHYVPTLGRELALAESSYPHRETVEALTANARATGIRLFGLEDSRQGIVHVIGPELGLSQPGMVIVCGDSHTSTHGALGALAFGVGNSEVEHVLATQTLWQTKPKSMRVTLSGRLGFHVHAKDLILALIAKISAAGGTGHVIEYAGEAIRSMSIEGRLTICNMSIEAGARAGMVAPDDTTFQYLSGRPFAPTGVEWDRALRYWRSLPSGPEAVFDTEVGLDASDVAPMVTWGTSPQDAVTISQSVPDPAADPSLERRAEMQRALEYMGLTPGTPLEGIAIDRVFIGSCTNSRIEDLRAAAEIVRGARAAIPAAVVPGSTQVKRQAEAEGLNRVFIDAGFEWRSAGCSMCVGMNGDLVGPRQRCASTSNRNFVGRQGIDARTHLMSPVMAAAAAITGRLTDVRRLASGKR
jgi:3-isopropylmalate/(R)-2-methylmalate dehydratase large subunit